MGLKEEIVLGSYLPTSFLDWDGRVSAVAFTSGCNFRCPWCHNSALVRRETERVPADKVLSDIERRKKFLDGVVVSGGEPCIWGGLIPFLKKIRGFGLEVKLDTNGYFPDVLEILLAEGLVSCVAMDIKAPFDEESLRRLTGCAVQPFRLRRSVELIKNKALGYEFRTTYVPHLLSFDDLFKIREGLDDDVHWIVQCFRPVGCLDERMTEYPAAKSENVKKLLPGIKVRG